MKKYLLLGIIFLTFLNVQGQSFNDDFESYATGSYLGSSSPDWTTWSGTTGGAEDVQITTANSNSGSNSLYFSSTTTAGGPQDVVLPFDQVYDSGNFSFEAAFYVQENKGAYFNLQGTLTVAEIWALDCYMTQDGVIELSNSGTPYLTATYPVQQWFNLRIEMDLTGNVWELFINNLSQGTFSNPTGQIGILDLYPVNPGNGQSGFYVDDVSYTHIPADLPAENGGVTFVDPIAGIAGQSVDVRATVRNLGSENINSFEISYDYLGSQVQESVTGVVLSSLDTYEHIFSTPITLADGDNQLTVSVSSVNGLSVDGNPDDDSKWISIDPIIPAPGKIVVGEEATGTWCQWCPRGAVYMDIMAEKYPDHWAGIAVHNADPMTDIIYDTGINALIGGYPSALVDRGPDNDPSAMEQSFLQRVVLPPAAFVVNGATFDETSRVLNVSVSSSFQSNNSGNWRIACVLTEDGVTGTGSSYAQSNAYSGGANGEMGGYELLSNPVPASQMVYDHVARAIQPSFAGDGEIFPSTIPSGSTYTACFEFTLPIAWDENAMHIVSLLIDPSGDIDNAGYTSIQSAISNGIEACTVGLEDNESKLGEFRLFPNPATDQVIIKLSNVLSAGTVGIELMDLRGGLLTSLEYKNPDLSGIPLNTSKLASGIYIVRVSANGQVAHQRLVIE